MSMKRYLDNAQRNNRDTYVGVDGTIDDQLYYTDDQVFSADGNGMPEAAAPAAVPQSQPYIITISNASAVAVNNFDVLGAFAYINNTGFSAGSLTINGVTISSSIPNYTYQQLLYQTMNMPFTVGMTYYASTSGTNLQVLQPISVTTADANGNSASRLLVPNVDPYQNQQGIIALNTPYSIDGNTKLTISSVLASSVFQLKFYPADNINPARGLRGTPISRQFGNPQIVKSSIAVLDGQTIKSRLG